VGIIGPNGSGKTTLLKVLLGELNASGGKIRLGANVALAYFDQLRVQFDEAKSLRDNIADGNDTVFINGVPRHVVGYLQDFLFPPAQILAPVGSLSGGERNRLLLAKLFCTPSNVLVLDEPTAVLTPQEAQELNAVVKRMLAEGKSAIFITHKMDEVMAFSDRVMVLRKGRVVIEKTTKDTNPKELARMMVGREVLFHIDKQPFEPGSVVLELRDVCAEDERGLPALRNLSLTLRAGEILGIAGVAGNGQRELSEVITGLRSVTSGGISINCVDSTNKTPLQIIKSGVSHIPQDRIAVGAVGDMSVANNLAMKDYRAAPISVGALLLPRRILEFARKMIGMFNISTPSPETRVKFLSGGNIQKTILAREIESCGSLLVAVYPSRGLDIGATEGVRKELVAQRDAGKAVRARVRGYR